MKMKEKDGEYIYLNWEGKANAYYIRGWVSHEDGIQILFGESQIDKENEVGQANHRYARWSMEAGDDGNRLMFRDYKHPGRGRFKVTEFAVK